MENKKLSSLNFEVGNKYKLTLNTNKNINDAYGVASEFYVSYFEDGVCLINKTFNNEEEAMRYYTNIELKIESRFKKVA